MTSVEILMISLSFHDVILMNILKPQNSHWGLRSMPKWNCVELCLLSLKVKKTAFINNILFPFLSLEDLHA